MPNQVKNNQSELESLLSLPELARKLNVSERTLHRWHALRSGPRRTKLGRAIYYRQDDLDAWIRTQRGPDQ